MSEVARGVTPEVQEWAGAVGLWAHWAECFERTRYPRRSEHVRAKRWDELSEEEQDHEGIELVQLAELAGSFPPTMLIQNCPSPELGKRVNEALDAYCASLPLSISELHWFMEQFYEAEAHSPPPVLSGVMQQRGEIVTGGRQVTADGAEMVNRMWDWMRGAGDFAPPDGTYEGVTRAALLKIRDLGHEVKDIPPLRRA